MNTKLNHIRSIVVVFLCLLLYCCRCHGANIPVFNRYDNCTAEEKEILNMLSKKYDGDESYIDNQLHIKNDHYFETHNNGSLCPALISEFRKKCLLIFSNDRDPSINSHVSNYLYSSFIETLNNYCKNKVGRELIYRIIAKFDLYKNYLDHGHCYIEGLQKTVEMIHNQITSANDDVEVCKGCFNYIQLLKHLDLIDFNNVTSMKLEISKPVFNAPDTIDISEIVNAIHKTIDNKIDLCTYIDDQNTLTVSKDMIIAEGKNSGIIAILNTDCNGNIINDDMFKITDKHKNYFKKSFLYLYKNILASIKDSMYHRKKLSITLTEYCNQDSYSPDDNMIIFSCTPGYYYGICSSNIKCGNGNNSKYFDLKYIIKSKCSIFSPRTMSLF